MEKTDLEKRLENGDFSVVYIYDWFQNLDFDHIEAAIKGCDKTINFNLLKFIMIYSKAAVENPEILTKEFFDHNDDKSIVEMMELIYPGAYRINSPVDVKTEFNELTKKHFLNLIHRSLDVCSRYSQYNDIVECLADSKNKDLNILYFCNTEKYGWYLEDETKLKNHLQSNGFDDIKRILNILCLRRDAYRSRHFGDLDKRERMGFLMAGLKNGAIRCMATSIPGVDDKTNIMIDSLFFNYMDTSFDADIYPNIKDPAPLAYTILTLAGQGKIEFNTSILPKCFDEYTKNEEKVKTKIKDNN